MVTDFSCGSAMKAGGFICSAIFTSFAIAEPNPSEALTQITFAGRSITLTNDGGYCALKRSDDSLLRLEVKWPCRFSKNFRGKAVIEEYRATQIFMVQHREYAAPPEAGCTTNLQAVRYYKGKVELAPVTQASRCLADRWDQKVVVWQFDW